jgi:hypothetical protein
LLFACFSVQTYLWFSRATRSFGSLKVWRLLVVGSRRVG